MLEGHELFVETNAGIGTGFTDNDYVKAGATICDVKDTFDKAEMIIKVKEPQTSELSYFRRNQILFTYLHLVQWQKVDGRVGRHWINFNCIRNNSVAESVVILVLLQ